MNKWALGAIMGSVVGVIALGAVGVNLSLKEIDRLSTKVGSLTAENQQLSRDIDRQSTVIADQALTFQRANHLSSEAYRHGLTQQAITQERKIEYKTILKKQPTCDLPVPRALSDGVLSNAHRIRARALSADPENLNATGAPILTGRILTYCDLALWVDPLLTDLEQANTQLMTIGQLDSERQHEKIN